MSEALRLAAELIEGGTAMVLATSDADGTPRSAPLFYWAEGLNLFWLSAEDARHSVNLRARSRVAVSVYANVADWREIRGVQMEGMAEPVYEPGKRKQVIESYRNRLGLGEELEFAIAGTTLYSFQAVWVRYIDNRRGFGFKLEAIAGT